ncbi:RnfABCDGE type electron transport complex subunit G [Sedimentibacter sp. zth1]|uniref:RnfABCDGE type electron transport complex subunit G n=1 Tax=Sedimentibacter sp. zth1 TaxID=2816908 RepID=UPI001A91EF17|nr:RnfABCDGE type electron transport complex subunit G [Sedimentibacter sp. zth1]QSX06204.1 RnfABCDGE type electron transport complex subunit G [Sedimentibacter sp. zth1]
MKNEIVKLGLILLIITALAGTFLSVANHFTKDIIDKAIEDAKSGEEVVKAVFPEAKSMDVFDEALEVKIKEQNEKFISLKICKDESGNDLGYAIQTLSTRKGYDGDIEIIVGISLEGKVVGIKVTQHAETPGLGSHIEDAEYQQQFIGKSTDTELKVSKTPKDETEVEALGGATYSSKSFTSAINNAMAIYNEFLK